MTQPWNMNIFHLSSYTFTGYAIPPFFVAVLCVFVAIIVLLHENFSKASMVFGFMVLFNGPTWFMSNALMMSANDSHTAMFWFKVHHVGYVSIPTVLLLFSLTVRNIFQRYKYVFWSFLVINLLFIYMALFTNILIIGTLKYTWGYYPQYGYFGMIHILIYSSMLSFNIFLFIQGLLEAKSDVEKLRMKLFIISIFVGSLAMVNFIAYFNVPLYPFGCVPIFAFFILFAVGILKYNIIEIEPEMASYQIINTMTEILIITNLQGVIQIINPATEDFFRLHERNIVGRHLSVFFDDPVFDEKGAEAFVQNTRSINNYEMVYRARSEEKMILDLSASELKDSSDKTVGIVFTAKDRTEYKRVQENIKNAYSVTQKILEMVPIGIVILSIDKKINIINKAALKIFGINSKEDVIGSASDDLSGFFIQEKDQPVFNGEAEDVDYETAITMVNGRKIYLLKSIIKMKLNDEEVFLEAVVDITKRKSLEEEIVKYKDYLEEQVEERTGKLQISNKQLISEVNICKEISNSLKEKLEILEQCKQETVDREREMIEIKKVINDFSTQLNRPAPYNLSFLK